MFRAGGRFETISWIACGWVTVFGFSACSGGADAPVGMMFPASSTAGTVATTTAGASGMVGSSAVVAGMSASTEAGKPASTPGSAGSVATNTAGVLAGGAGAGAATAGSGTAGVGAAGAAAAGSGGAAAGSGGAAGGGANPTHEDLGKGDGTDVVLLGDSYMSNSLNLQGTGGGIVPSLLRVSGQLYRNYSVQGTMLLMDDAFGAAIPTQWDTAKRANAKIKTVVMTGGGNDIIQNAALKASCQMGGDECKQLLTKVSQAFDKLWTQMADSGVADIIHVRYTEDTDTVAPSLQGDKGVMTPAICMTGRVRCHSFATTALIMKQLASDGIHPLQAANDRMAQAIFDLMTREGMRR
jgi:hypothetical protein